jgi:hypothetical protein
MPHFGYVSPLDGSPAVALTPVLLTSETDTGRVTGPIFLVSLLKIKKKIVRPLYSKYQVSLLDIKKTDSKAFV